MCLCGCTAGFGLCLGGCTAGFGLGHGGCTAGVCLSHGDGTAGFALVGFGLCHCGCTAGFGLNLGGCTAGFGLCLGGCTAGFGLGHGVDTAGFGFTTIYSTSDRPTSCAVGCSVLCHRRLVAAPSVMRMIRCVAVAINKDLICMLCLRPPHHVWALWRRPDVPRQHWTLR